MRRRGGRFPRLLTLCGDPFPTADRSGAASPFGAERRTRAGRMFRLGSNGLQKGSSLRFFDVGRSARVAKPPRRGDRSIFFFARSEGGCIPAREEPVQKPLVSRDGGSFRVGAGGHADGHTLGGLSSAWRTNPSAKNAATQGARVLLTIRCVARAGDSPYRDTPTAHAPCGFVKISPRHGHQRFPGRLHACRRR